MSVHQRDHFLRPTEIAVRLQRNFVGDLIRSYIGLQDCFEPGLVLGLLQPETIWRLLHHRLLHLALADKDFRGCTGLRHHPALPLFAVFQKIPVV